MLVLTRQRCEGINLGDEALVAVYAIAAEATVLLVVPICDESRIVEKTPSARIFEFLTPARIPAATRGHRCSAVRLARDEAIALTSGARVTVVDIRGDRIRLGIECPKTMPVHRTEVRDAILGEYNCSACQPDPLMTPIAEAACAAFPNAVLNEFRDSLADSVRSSRQRSEHEHELLVKRFIDDATAWAASFEIPRKKIEEEADAARRRLGPRPT